MPFDSHPTRPAPHPFLSPEAAAQVAALEAMFPLPSAEVLERSWVCSNGQPHPTLTAEDQGRFMAAQIKASVQRQKAAAERRMARRARVAARQAVR